jgi:hypothetical protein
MKFRIKCKIITNSDTHFVNYNFVEFCSNKAAEIYLSTNRFFPYISLKEEMELSIRDGSGLIFKVEKV